jgi:Plasmid stabilization system protein
MAKYYFSNKAVEDLTKIYEYTFEFWSENHADKYYQELIESCELLAENPNIGKNYTEIDSKICGFLANKHIIFYRVIDVQQIEVIRILGAQMDLKNRIKE